MYRGFTLIECLVALALTALTLTGAVLSYHNLQQQRLLSHHLSLWTSTLHFARLYALSSGKTVSACPSTDYTACENIGYESGWIVFAENPDGTVKQLDPGERVLTSSPAWRRSLSLRSNISEPLSFNARGQAFPAGRFVVCIDNDPEKSAGIIINPPGRTRRAGPGEIAQCLID